MYFLCELAWEMLSTEQMSLNYRLFPDRIRRLFGSVVQEEKDKETFGRSPLTKAVMDLILGMINKESGVEKLLEVIEATKGKSETEVSYVGGNAATVLVKRALAKVFCGMIKGFVIFIDV